MEIIPTAVAPRVGIIMGSDSDLPVMKDAAKILREFNVPAEVNYANSFLWFLVQLRDNFLIKYGLPPNECYFTGKNSLSSPDP